MANIIWKTKEQIDNEILERQRQREIKSHEQALSERYSAFSMLLATNASQEEIDVCKQEIQTLIQSLEVLRNGTITIA